MKVFAVVIFAVMSLGLLGCPEEQAKPDPSKAASTSAAKPAAASSAKPADTGGW
jgi:hypothetical protein